MTARTPAWVTAFQHTSVNGSHARAEELVDVCLLLALSERVQMLLLDPELERPQLLGRSLRSLGLQADSVGDQVSAAVAASDTVVAFVGPDSTRLAGARPILTLQSPIGGTRRRLIPRRLVCPHVQTTTW